MRIRTGYKINLALVLAITAVMLCILPFLAWQKETLYVYTSSSNPDNQVKALLKEFRYAGYRVRLNAKTGSSSAAVCLWLKTLPPEGNTSCQNGWNFVYTEEYAPQKADEKTILLTPYRTLFEHYSRSNIKTALFTIGVDLSAFYPDNQKKLYPVAYWGDNNKPSLVAEAVQTIPSARILGDFWGANPRVLKPAGNSFLDTGNILRAIGIVVFYDAEQGAKIPQEVMAATASGALVIMNENSAVKEAYSQNVITYQSEEDMLKQVAYYLQNPQIAKQKVISAQQITAQKYSIHNTVQHFTEILAWLKADNLMQTAE